MEYYLRNIDLRNDVESICELLIKCDIAAHLFQHLNFINKEDCQNWLLGQLSGYFHDFYVIEGNSGANNLYICGFIMTYDYRVYDSHCQIYGYLRQGITEEVLKKFLLMLFREYPLRKVFLEVTELDDFLLAAARAVGFKEEARFLDNKYIKGNYHDLMVLSIYVDDFLRRE